MHIETVTDDTQFEALLGAWRELDARSDTDCLYTTAEWLSAWWRHFSHGRQLRVLVAREGEVREGEADEAGARGTGRVLGIGPFVAGRREGFRQASLMGGRVTDYKDFILDQDTDHTAVLDAMLGALLARKDIDLVQVSGLREDSPNFAALTALLPRYSAHRPICKETDTGVYVKMEGSLDDYWRRLGRGFRENCRRQIGRLGALEGGFSYYCPTAPEEIHDTVEIMLRQKLDRWRQTKHDAVMMEEAAVRDFYHDVALQLSRTGWLWAPALMVNGRAAAVDVGAAYRGRYYSIQHSFDEAFSTYSTGRLLNLEIIRWAYERGWREMDLGLGSEAYKFDFKPYVRKLYTITLFQTGVRGEMAEAWLSHLRPRVEHIVQRGVAARPLREWLRRMKDRRG